MAVSNTTSTRPTNSTTSSSSSTSTQRRHTVRQGENLWSIAKQHSPGQSNADVSRYHQDLIKANPQLRDPNVIRPGQELNLPDAANVSGGRASRIKPSTVDSARSTYESSSSAPPPQTARPDANAQSTNHPPVSGDLADEVTARRTAAHTNPTGRARGARPAAEEEEQTQQAQGQQPAADDWQSARGAPDFARRNMPNANIRGNNVRRGFQDGTDVQSGTHRRHSETSVTENRRDTQWRDTNSETIESTAGGQRSHQLQEENVLRDRRTGESASETTTVAQDQDGRFGGRTTESSSGPDERSRMQQLMEQNGPNPVSANATLYNERIAGDDRYHGVATVDNRHTADETGAGYEAHALAYRAEANRAATVDLTNGEVNVGINGSVQADLVGGSVSGQVGERSSVRGAAFGEAEAHVGARAEGGASIAVSPNNVGVRLGGEAFAGAEVKGTAGYENRYFGASVTGRAQAGAGAAAGVDIGYRDGTVGVHADLGAAVGLGGRVTVDVNVNVRAIASDVSSAVSDVADDVRSTVGDAADNVREGASRAWSAINPFD